MNKDSKIFETQNVDLGTFLVMEGVSFLGCKRSDTNPRVVVMQFDNAKQNCLDLERVFFSSDFKKYRDLNKWLLGKIHEALRS